MIYKELERKNGHTIIVKNAIEGYKLNILAIDGKSEQNQYSGNQLIDDTDFRNITLTSSHVLSAKLEEAGTYTVSCLITGGTEQGVTFVVRLNDESIKQVAVRSGTPAKIALTEEEIAQINRVSLATFSGSVGATLNWIMLNKGDTILPYEPYCGGIPSPNPSYTQEIRNIGVYDEASGKYAVEVKCNGKNFLKNTLTTQTVKGVTITKNEDGTVTANGTATEEIVLVIATKKDLNLTTGKYVLNGCPSEGSGSKYFMNMYNHDGTSGLIYDTGTGVPFDFTNETSEYNVAVNIAKGYTANNLVFKPMIRLAEITDDTYEPYKETTATVYLDEPLRKGDKAYWNGEKMFVERKRAVIESYNGEDINTDYLSTTGSLDNGALVEYQLATPTTEEIDIDLDGLSMFYPTTILSNDCNANMEVEYSLYEYRTWDSQDRFNIDDYNRIKQNLSWIHKRATRLYKSFDIADMGEDITSFESYWNVAFFNAFESNVETINNNIYTKEYGTSQRFFENGPFIKWDELNRIESACLAMKDILDRQESGLQRLAFRLGGMKGVNS